MDERNHPRGHARGDEKSHPVGQLFSGLQIPNTTARGTPNEGKVGVAASQ